MCEGQNRYDQAKVKSLGGIEAQFGLRLVAFVVIFSIYTLGVLYVTDYSLSKLLPGYIFSGKYGLGVLIFIPAAVIFVLIAKYMNWITWRFYVLGSLAIFFPLVFFSSAVTVLFKSDSALVTQYVEQYCAADSGYRVCGEAFAITVFSMSLRALPTVLTAPGLGWYLFFYNRSTQ